MNDPVTTMMLLC